MLLIKSLLLSAIAAYRKLVSPFLPPSCRFYPSCSQYAAAAVDKHGTVRGICLAIKRLSRCHPWHPGGYDPVPDPKAGSRNAWQETPATVEVRTRTTSS